MTTFQSLLKDNVTNYIYIQGSYSHSTSNDISGVILQNYDDDDKLKYNMAAITLKDHFGNSNSNGYGDMLFKTSSSNVLSEKMRVQYDGLVGIGVSNPLYNLHVMGTIKADQIITDGLVVSNFVTDNVQERIFFPNINRLYNDNDSYVVICSVLTNQLLFTNTVYFSSYLELNQYDISFNYDIRLMDVSARNIVFQTTYSNVTPMVFSNALSWTSNDDLQHLIEFQVKKTSGSYISIENITFI